MITFKIYNILSVIILPSVNIQINKNVTHPILTMTSAISICLQTHINCSYYLLTAQSPIKIFIKKDPIRNLLAYRVFFVFFILRKLSPFHFLSRFPG